MGKQSVQCGNSNSTASLIILPEEHHTQCFYSSDGEVEEMVHYLMAHLDRVMETISMSLIMFVFPAL